MRLSLAALGGLLLAAPALADDPLSERYSALPATANVTPVNPNGDLHEVTARLLVDQATVAPGVPFRLGVQLTPKEHWHTYWKSPRDVGLPTLIDWTLPEGAKVTPYDYPLPERFADGEQISYGYDGPVLLYADVTLPEGTPEGVVELGAHATWLVCQTTCNPGEVRLSLPVSVGATAANGPFKEVFDETAKKRPLPLTSVPQLAIEAALDASSVRVYDTHRVVLRAHAIGDEPIAPTDREWPTFAPIMSSSSWFLNAVEVGQSPQGDILAVVTAQAINEDLPTDDRVGGLFQLKVGDTWIATEFTTTLPWVAEGAAIEPGTSPLLALAGVAPHAGTGEVPPLAAEGSGGATPSGGMTPPAPQAPGSLPFMLAMAFLGGLLLNIMPCVFPVLTLKLFGLVSHSDASTAHQRKAGLAYTAGILASFWALAGAVLAAKAAAGGVGWGFQFQSPLYVATLATLVFAFGLSMFGVFEVPAIGADAASDAVASKEGVAGDFVNGIFATLLATPCTAPFLGPAVGFAFTQSPPIVMLFFTVIGLGLASPFLLVAFVPALFNMLPSPGEWMETFKQFMGFTLMATTIWMIDILAAQVGADNAIGFLAFLAFVALGCWIFGRWGGLAETRQRQLGAFLVGLAVTSGGAYAFVDLDLAPPDQCDDGSLAADLDYSDEIPWQPFSRERLDALQGKLVFVDFTADWCLTCKVNEKTILETQAVREAMASHGVVPLKADWTRQDPYISEWLSRFGRAGVPFYVVIPPSGEPQPLPDVLTTDRVVAALGG